MGFSVTPKGMIPHGYDWSVSVSSARNKIAIDDAIDQALNTGNKIEMPGCCGDRFYCEPLEPLNEEHSCTLNISGQGKRNTVIDVVGEAPWLTLGDSARLEPNATQDWGGIVMGDMSLITQEATHGVAFEWRYADSSFYRLHHEGFTVQGSGELNPEPKSWTRSYIGCDFAHNKTGLKSCDHVLYTDPTCRFYFNDVGVELGSLAKATIFGDFGPAAEAQIKVTGGGTVSSLYINAYLENGYDLTTGNSTALSIDPRPGKTITPVGAILIEDATVWGMTIDTSHAQMQASEWLVRIDNPTGTGSAADRHVRAIYRGGLLTKNAPGGDVWQLVNPSAPDQNKLVHEHVYHSNGLFNAVTNDPQSMCVSPASFGLAQC